MNDIKSPNRIGARGLNAFMPILVLWIMGLLTLHAFVPGHSGQVCSEPALQVAMGMDDGDESEGFHAVLPPLVFADAGSLVATGFFVCPQSTGFQSFDAGAFHFAHAPPTSLI